MTLASFDTGMSVYVGRLRSSYNFKALFCIRLQANFHIFFPIGEGLQSKVYGKWIHNFIFYGNFCDRRKDYPGHAMTFKLSDVYSTAYFLFLTAISL